MRIDIFSVAFITFVVVMRLDIQQNRADKTDQREACSDHKHHKVVSELLHDEFRNDRSKQTRDTKPEKHNSVDFRWIPRKF